MGRVGDAQRAWPEMHRTIHTNEEVTLWKKIAGRGTIFGRSEPFGASKRSNPSPTVADRAVWELRRQQGAVQYG
jgi:hypothetical protein